MSELEFEYLGLKYTILANGNCRYHYNDGEVVVEEGDTPYSGDIIVPETIIHEGKAYTVVGIGWGAFEYCVNLTSIQLPNTLRFIGFSAFWGCCNLTSIKLPDSVEVIESFVFEGCSGLTEFALPASLKTIQYLVFHGCFNLNPKLITGPQNVLDIATEAKVFDDVSAIILELNGVYYELDKSGEAYAIRCNENLKGDITIPEKVVHDGVEYKVTQIQGAFSNNQDITSVVLPETLKEIKKYSFLRCVNLRHVTLPASLEKIGLMAFDMCYKLEPLEIPENVIVD